MAFSNVTFNDRIDSFNKAQKDKMKNPYYAFSAENKTLVIYFHINKAKSTLDDGTHGLYDTIGPESGLRWNKIHNFPLYGLDKMLVDMNIGEYGLESAPIEGDCLILPNTVIPNPEDYFIVPLLNNTLLFRVTSVTPTMIENDNLMYKISYTLDSTGRYDKIDKQVIYEYDTIDGGVPSNKIPNTSTSGYGSSSSGSNTSSGAILGSISPKPDGSGVNLDNNGKSTNSGTAGIGSHNMDRNGMSTSGIFVEMGVKNILNDLMLIIRQLTDWYIDIFYNFKLEAFILNHRGEYLYDEYLTEFIIRNKIVSPNEYKIHVMHQTNIPKTFSVDYEKTIFRFIETQDKDIADYTIKAYPLYIDDLGSTLSERYYHYYKMRYIFNRQVYTTQTNIISVLLNELVYHIEHNVYDDSIGYMNIITKHLNLIDISKDDLLYLKDVYPQPTIEWFYNTPILIVILHNLVNSIRIGKTLK